MTVLWCGFIGLFILRLVKNHGWEYVPLVLLVFGTWWQWDQFSDEMLLAAISGVYFVTRKAVQADCTWSEHSTRLAA